MDIEIREYQQTDYIFCRSLYGELASHNAVIYEDQSISGEDPGRGFDEYLTRTDRRCTWVAETNGEIVAFAGLLASVGEENVGEIEPVIVSLKSRGKGIGTKLIEYIVDEAKRRGFHFLSIRPALRNEKAFALYVKLGFDNIGSVVLFRQLLPESNKKWKPGIVIHGKNLKY